MDLSHTSTSAAESLPAELWLEILTHVPQSYDLHGLSITSRKFHALTTRFLHRDLIWVHAPHVSQNLPLWQRHAHAGNINGMETSVRTLTLGLDGVPPLPNGDLAPHPLSPPNELQSMIWERVRTFTNLRALAFTRMALHNAHFALIHSLPCLRSLRLESCAIAECPPALSATDGALPLALTDVTLRDIRSDPREPLPVGLQYLLPYFRELAFGEKVTTLTVDPAALALVVVYETFGAQEFGWMAPRALEQLYVVRHFTLALPPRRTCAGSGWVSNGADEGPDEDEESEDEESEDDESEDLQDDLYQFCAEVPTLKTISAESFVCHPATFAPSRLPPALERIAARAETALMVAAARDIRALGLLDVSSTAAAHVLAETVRVRPGLRMLMMEVDGWDAGVVAGIAAGLRELRRLKFVYADGGPDEDYLHSFGSACLAGMPELHTLEMYQLPPDGRFGPVHPAYVVDPSYGSVEAELRDILGGWGRSCPKLRRVQLVSGYVMRRAFDGAVWELERVEKLEQIEDLDY